MKILVVHWSVYRFDDEIKKVMRIEKAHKIFRFSNNDYRGVQDEEECAQQVIDREGLRSPVIFGLAVGGPYTAEQYEKIWG